MGRTAHYYYMVSGGERRDPSIIRYYYMYLPVDTLLSRYLVVAWTLRWGWAVGTLPVDSSREPTPFQPVDWQAPWPWLPGWVSVSRCARASWGVVWTA